MGNNSYVCYSTDMLDARRKADERKSKRKPKTNWKRDDIKAVRRAAEHGNLSAMYELSQRLFNGRSVAMDRGEAVGWCKEAAGRNHAPSLNMLGWCLATGTVLPRDPKGAARCFAKASKKLPLAAYNLGICYLEGIGVPRNPISARLRFEAAAEKGLPVGDLLRSAYVGKTSSGIVDGAKNPSAPTNAGVTKVGMLDSRALATAKEGGCHADAA